MHMQHPTEVVSNGEDLQREIQIQYNGGLVNFFTIRAAYSQLPWLVIDLVVLRSRLPYCANVRTTSRYKTTNTYWCCKPMNSKTYQFNIDFWF